MATYRELIGKKIKVVSSDPSSGTDGEMWYNSTTGTLRGLAISEAWSSGAAMPTSDGIKYGAGAGTQTAGLFFGGNDNPPGTRRDETFEYNGSGWAAGGSLTAPWYLGGGMGTTPYSSGPMMQQTSPGMSAVQTGLGSLNVMDYLKGIWNPK